MQLRHGKFYISKKDFNLLLGLPSKYCEVEVGRHSIIVKTMFMRSYKPKNIHWEKIWGSEIDGEYVVKIVRKGNRLEGRHEPKIRNTGLMQFSS